MNSASRILVADRGSMLGKAIARELARQGFHGLIDHRLNPAVTADVNEFFGEHRPEYVFLAAGLSGGIAMNQRHPALLMTDNLVVQANVIQAAHRFGVRKLLYLASSCTYPRLAPQPMRIESLMTGKLEPTNEAYAVAKLAGLVMCQAYRQEHGDDFIAGIPANAFGPDDDFRPEEGHVIGALMTRMTEAREAGLAGVDIWGTGAPRREFVFADDLASACIFVMQHYSGVEPINLGGGTDISIAQLARLIQGVVGFSGELRFDTSKPDGMPLKRLDSSALLGMGWKPATPFEDALRLTYASLLKSRQAEAIHA